MPAGTLRSAVAREAERWEIPALVLGLLRPDGSTEVLTAGEAERSSRFRVASVTKPFTGYLAARLAVGGKLEVAKAVFHDASVAALLGHVAGLPAVEPAEPERFGDGDDALAAIVAEVGPPELPRVWSYSNPGYWIVGDLCARVADSTYEEALHRHVLEPLGLHDTGFEEDGVLRGHHPYEPVPERFPRARRPGGGLVSTADDLLRFAHGYLTRVDPAATVMLMRVARAIGCDWGLGWQLRRNGVVGHSGNWGGFRSRLGLVRSAGVAAVALASSARAGAAVETLVDLALEELAGVRPEQVSTVDLPPGRLDELAGDFRRGELTFTVRRAGAGLRVEEPGYPPLAGVAVSDSEFVVLDGEDAGDRFDFPLPGWARLGSRLAERVA